MQLYFIRHGQSNNNALWDRTGGSKGRDQDPELTDGGRLQAEILARFLGQDGPGNSTPLDRYDPQNTAGFGITHLYTSLMVRAVTTGTVVAHTLGLPLVAWLDLHEGGGIFLEDEETGEMVGLPGKNRTYFETHYPDMELPENLGEQGWWNRPFEPLEQRRTRAIRVLGELLRRHAGTRDRVAFISHGGFCNYFMSVMFGLSGCDETEEVESKQLPGLPPGRWFLMNNAAITRVDFSAEEIRLVYQNRTDFLPRELIT